MPVVRATLAVFSARPTKTPNEWTGIGRPRRWWKDERTGDESKSYVSADKVPFDENLNPPASLGTAQLGSLFATMADSNPIACFSMPL